MKVREFDKYLCNKYPDLFRERNLPMSQTCMCNGISCEEGWQKTIEELSDILVFLQKCLGVEIVAKQVKEKLGTLRFYWDIVVDDTNKDIDLARVRRAIGSVVSYYENRTEHICEFCGKYGNLCTTKTGWKKTLCSEHKEEKTI